ncbi:hypothetical protein Trydic_g13049 [Trypoxylus dichotomus]
MMRIAYVDVVPLPIQVFRCYKAFKYGRETIDENPSSTSKPDESVAKVFSVLPRDRRLTLGMIGHEASMSKDTIHRIVAKKDSSTSTDKLIGNVKGSKKKLRIAHALLSQ